MAVPEKSQAIDSHLCKDRGVTLGNPRPRVEQVRGRAENPKIDFHLAPPQRLHALHCLGVQRRSGIVAEEFQIARGRYAETESAGQP